MLAYRHSFHAGNHADVLKHVVQTAVLNHYNAKDKPYWVVDTHAGAGMYSLRTPHAQLKTEYMQGIAKLLGRDDLPALVKQYVDLVHSVNGDALEKYPGSPSLTAALIRAEDKQKLFELHPTDFTLLREHFAGDRSVQMRQDDGFAGLKSVLPPAPRRAVVLIDPSYELKEDYVHVVTALKQGLERFAQGTYVIWYPILNRPEWRRMIEKLEKMNVKWLSMGLKVAEPDDEGFGMLGSGLFVVNPPFGLEKQMREVLPFLVKALGQYKGATFDLAAFEPRIVKAAKAVNQYDL